MENCPGILNFFPRKEKSKDSTTGQPEEAEDGEEAEAGEEAEDGEEEAEDGEEEAEGGEAESSSAMPAIGRKKECPEELKAPIADLEKKLRSKAPDLTGQNATRHQAVLRFLYYQKTRQKTDTRQSMALQVARCFNRRRWFAERLVSWELSWKKDRTIPTGKQGCFQKVKSWLADEGVELAVREYLSGAGESK
jgi:cobalamin biosynthesis protein CobT